MSVLLALLIACGDPAPAPAPAPPEPVAEAPAPAPAPAPAGRIGGEPILDKPMVVGAIHQADIDARIDADMETIRGCYAGAAEAGRKGKVLVKFLIGPDGAVTETTTRSTSLRHAPTEACINDTVASMTFPPLKEGRLAIVHYPFSVGEP